MIKLLKTIGWNFFNSKRQTMKLGRWCHKDYSEKCDVDIKSHLANIDNSSSGTGLCLSSKINKKPKKLLEF